MRTLASRETVKIQLDEDFFIEVKKELTHGEKRGLRANLYTINKEGQPELSKEDLESHSPDLIMLSVVNWDLCDVDGKVLPITREVIDLMNDNDVQLILRALTKHYQDDPEEKKQ